MGLEELGGVGTRLGDRITALITGRISDISWNGRMFLCKANTVGGRIVKKLIALRVKGHYL